MLITSLFVDKEGHAVQNFKISFEKGKLIYGS